MTAEQHSFATWLVENHGKDDTPLGDLAREVAPKLPATGDCAKLRYHLYCTADEWLVAFDLAWALYDPNCSYSDCTEPASAVVMGRFAPMSVCAEHAQAVEDVL